MGPPQPHIQVMGCSFSSRLPCSLLGCPVGFVRINGDRISGWFHPQGIPTIKKVGYKITHWSDHLPHFRSPAIIQVLGCLAEENLNTFLEVVKDTWKKTWQEVADLIFFFFCWGKDFPPPPFPRNPNGLEHKLVGLVAWLDSKIKWLQLGFLDYPPVNFKMAMEIHPFYK